MKKAEFICGIDAALAEEVVAVLQKKYPGHDTRGGYHPHEFVITTSNNATVITNNGSISHPLLEQMRDFVDGYCLALARIATE